MEYNMRTVINLGVQFMQNKASYKTKQGDELRSYLESVPDRHITAADVCDYFRRSGKSIGMATVYVIYIHYWS